MNTAVTIVTLVLAIMTAGSAIMKLIKHEAMLNTLRDTIGLSDRSIPLIGAVELAGALGLIVGTWIRPVGIAAAIGLLLLFVLAILAHLRVGDRAGAFSPVVPLVLSGAVIALGSGTV